MKPALKYIGVIIKIDNEILIKNTEDGIISCYPISNVEYSIMGNEMWFEFRKWNSSIVTLIT
tara:strand:- start:2800 stop:2985 length:186 start_codon:yes stop_codon:yes gene_type:complete